MTEPGHVPAVEAVERELAMLFRRAHASSMALANQVHPGLEPAAYGLLSWLDGTGQVTAGEICDAIGLDKSTVSRQLNRLLGLGVVQRTPHPEDGRAMLVSISDEGRKRVAAARAGRQTILRQQLSHWPAEDIADFARLLHRLNTPG